jgi:ubiquinone/menaquinone biosynthesis C-methylase UbiE
MSASSIIPISATPHPAAPQLTYITEALTCCDDSWEDAYRRFETSDEEIDKFTSRLKKLGAPGWPRDAAIVEIFCGRANGLVALERLGFQNLEGVDLSDTLLRQYRGPAQLYVCDCRELHFEDNSKDFVIVQGGLHHLESLPDDLQQTLAQVQRVLRPGGRFVVVEPWMTPFLRFAHFVGRQPLLHRMWDKVEAFWRMIEIEGDVYLNWLSQPKKILGIFDRHFATEIRRERWGKLMYIGKKSD